LVAFLDAHGGFDLMTVNEAQTMWVLYFCGYSLMVTLDAHGGVPAQASRRIYRYKLASSSFLRFSCYILKYFLFINLKIIVFLFFKIIFHIKII
jgi:hypothetical protein